MSALQTIAAGFRRTTRLGLRIVAGVLILLALLVGVARLLLPEASTFTEDIRIAVRDASGFDVDCKQISAGISAYGPELRFNQTSVFWPDGTALIAADEVSVSLDLPTLLGSRKIAPGRISVAGATVDIRLDAAGELLIQQRPWRELLPAKKAGSLDELPEASLHLSDIRFSFTNDRRDGARIEGTISNLDGEIDDESLSASADIAVEEDFGRGIAVRADVPLALLESLNEPDSEGTGSAVWNVSLSAESFRLAKWLDIAQITNSPVADSQGRVDVSLTLDGTMPQNISADFDLQQLLLAQPSGPPALFNRLAGKIGWEARGSGWEAQGRGVRVEREAGKWPTTAFTVRRSIGLQQGSERIVLNTNFLRLQDLLSVARALAPDRLADAGFSGNVSGDLRDLGLDASIVDGKLGNFALDAAFEEAGYSVPERGIDVSGFTGSVSANEGGGTFELDTRAARFGLQQVFRGVIDLSALEGIAIWRAGPQGHRVLADRIRLATPDGEGAASLELTLDENFANPVIDLTATARLDDVAAVSRYLPVMIPPKVLGWLDQALVAGRIDNADIKFQGPLQEFPFDRGEGIFRILVDFADGQLRFAPDWPMIRKAVGQVEFDGVTMRVADNQFEIADIPVEDVGARIDDLRAGVLTLVDAGPVRLDSLLGFLRQTPIAEKLGPVFADVRATGSATASGELTLPIKELEKWRLIGSLETKAAELSLDGVPQRLSRLQGTLNISNAQLRASGLTGQLLGEAVTVDLEPVSTPGSVYSHRAFINGRMPVYKIQQALQLPASDRLSGTIDIDAQTLFPGGAGGSGELIISLRSDLVGMQSLFPDPLAKVAGADEGAQVDVRFPERGRIELLASLQRGLWAALEVSKTDAGWGVKRGAINRGAASPALPDEPGLMLSGALDTLDLDAWVGVFNRPAGGSKPAPLAASGDVGPRWQQLFRSADVRLGELFVLGFRFVDVDAAVKFAEASWEIELAGPWSSGRLSVPYDFTGSQQARLDMERLLLVEPQEGGTVAGEQPLSPLEVPSVAGRIEEFALGNLRMGALDVDIARIGDGLRSQLLKTTAASFSTDISYDWRVIDNAQRSRLHLELKSRDVADTLEQLGYSPLISAESGNVVADLIWEGGPGMASIYASTGKIDVNIRDGAVAEVDAGTGRILGLLSVTALPRRLSLDFKDMTEDGLPFDQISGTFRIDFGDAWTCNLGLEGTVADMGIVGRTGITKEDYDQVAAVRPHVSNLAPVAGAFLAGPTVGFATLLVTQILKKPLSSIGESYYRVQGSWDNPNFNKVDRSGFDAAAFADCEADLPTLSPEEIQALEDLMAAPADGTPP